jgi:hypothetical protein
MRLARTFGLLLLAATGLVTATAVFARRTVCTVTVNSPDEQETLRRFLPERAPIWPARCASTG